MLSQGSVLGFKVCFCFFPEQRLDLHNTCMIAKVHHVS